MRTPRLILAALLAGVAFASALWVAVLLAQWAGVTPRFLKPMLDPLAPFPGDAQPIATMTWPLLTLILAFAAFWVGLAASLAIEPKKDIQVYRHPSGSLMWVGWKRDDPEGLYRRLMPLGLVLGGVLALAVLPAIAKSLAG